MSSCEQALPRGRMTKPQALWQAPLKLARREGFENGAKCCARKPHGKEACYRAEGGMVACMRVLIGAAAIKIKRLCAA